MSETILFPSPNWFQSSVFVTSSDNWLIYGGPSKSLCVLEPIPQEAQRMVHGSQGYKAHILNRAHPDKVVCVDICPEWPAKRLVLTGSADGTVKQWSLEKVEQTVKFKATHNHEMHSHDKEEVAGVGYCNNGFAVTVGCHGQIVKWDLNSNVMKSFKKELKNFKPVCMACSPHVHLNVAIGTKQGVVIVLDLNGAPRILYKVRGHDDEIMKISWCPQYEVMIRKSLKESQKKSLATERMEKIRQEPELPEVLKELDERVKKSEEVEYFMNVKTKTEQIGKEEEDKPSDSSEQPNKEGGSSEQPEKENSPEQPVKQNASEQPAILTNDATEQPTNPKEELDESGIEKTLPEDSFDQSAVPEDDMFDIYVDHEADEFGHKKFQPIDIVVKIPEEKKEDEFLSECSKLKEVILMRKNEPETSIGALVDALDKTHVDDGSIGEVGTSQSESVCDTSKIAAMESSAHVQKHLLATISKHGSVRVWSKSGKLVASCAVPNNVSAKYQKNQRSQRNSGNWTTLLWYKPDLLLLVDGKSELLECNPLKMDCKAKLEWKVLLQQKRSIYTLATGAPRVQAAGEPFAASSVWMTSQDRTMVQYSVETRQALATYYTSGGFLYTVQNCPYDARKIAVSAGDGGVRIWEASISDEDESKLSLGHMTTYWNNVQGKVLIVAWHPTKENLIAFGTAESRVGLIDANGVIEKPAKVLPPAINGGVYSLYWGDGDDLYACAGGELVVYHTNKPEEAPTAIPVELEGHKWEVTTARWYAHALVCGSEAGAVAVMAPAHPYDVIAATFVFGKMIHMIDWHPIEVSASSEESPYKNLIAVCSMDRVSTIVVLQYADKEDGSKQLSTWKTLSGHKNSVLQVVWNPHVDALLLSTSQDATVRIWDVTEGVCVSVFDGHTATSLGGAWSAFPQLAGVVISGGGDCCLRLWDMAHHTAAKYEEKSEGAPKRDRRRKHNKDKKKAEDEVETEEPNAEAEPEFDEGVAKAILSKADSKLITYKRFLLPIVHRQTNPCSVIGMRKLLQKHLQSSGDGIGIDVVDPTESHGLDYLKLFGSINELNELLDDEMERHQDTGNMESFMMVCIFRGHIDTMVQVASQRDQLDPFLVGITPCVSIKYWKDVVQLYLAQIDRLIAKGRESKLCDKTQYGGAMYRKVAALLSLNDVKGAVAALTEASMFKEAYVLCRTRYIESIAEETLQKWADHSALKGNWSQAAVCNIVLGKLSQAATILSKSHQEDVLNLAADLAKAAGQLLFVDHIEKKKELLKAESASQNETEELNKLPSRLEQLLLTQEENPSLVPQELTLHKEEQSSQPKQEEEPSKEEELTVNKEEELTVNKEEEPPTMEDHLMKAKGEVPLEEKELTSAQEEILSRQEEVMTNTQKIHELSSQMEQMLDEHTQNAEADRVNRDKDNVNGIQVNAETPTNGDQKTAGTLENGDNLQE